MQKWLIITQTSLNDTHFEMFESNDPEEVWDKVQYTEGTGRCMAVQIEDVVRYLLIDLPRKDSAHLLEV